MFKRSLLKVASWTMAHASWMTMALSPVAMGKQAEKNAVDLYKQQVREIGLDKKMTAKEFWEKVKNDLPGYAYFEIEQAVKQNPNALMPKFEVSSSKTSDGQVIPVITFTENGKTNTIQMYGDKDKFMKYNNTVVSETDAKQPQTLFQKLIDGDAKLNKQYQDGLKKQRQISGKSAKNTTVKSNGMFSSMDKNTWKKMTMEQRVSYFIQMRMMYLDAKKVLELSNAAGKKTSSFNQLEMIYKAIFQDAEAQTSSDAAKLGTSSKKQVVKSLDGKKQISIPFDAQSCIVAGYVGKYVSMVNNVNGQKRPGCSVDVATANYANKPGLEYVVEANVQCMNDKGASGVACNPVIYGYPNGSPICVSKNSQEFQIATHWEGPCDTASRLSYSKDVVNTQGKDYSKIVPRSAQEEAIRKDQETQNLALTKAFIEGVLTKKDSNLLALFKDGKWSQALEDEINRMGSQFDKEIEEAIALCEKDVTAKNEKNQKGACDQLHRRKLFYKEFIKTLKKDDPPVVVISGDETLACPQGSHAPEGAPAGSCTCDNGKASFNVKEAGIEVCGDDPVPPVSQCDQYPPLKVGAELNTDCTCANKEGANGNIPKEDQPGFFQKLFNTKANKQFKKPSTEDGTRKSKKSTNNDQQREYSCKFGPNWWLIGAGALGIAGITYLLLKKKTKTVTNTVTNTVTETVDNTVTCTPPKYPVLIPNATRAGSTPKYECVCPPCGKYYLQNGTAVDITPNPLTCACEPPPTEGGSGNNPTDDGGSGGVPGQN